MIGLEDTFEEHLHNLVAVMGEVRRVLRPDGTCWLNYGDCYVGGGRGWNPNMGNLQQTHKGSQVSPSPVTPGFKPKDLMLMPARVAMALQGTGADLAALNAISRAITAIEEAYWDEPVPDRVLDILEGLEREYAQAKGDSWWVRSEVVWRKPNPMPESVTDRPTSAHEKVFMLSKQPRYFYDAEAVRVPQSEGTLKRFAPGQAPRKATRKKGEQHKNYKELEDKHISVGIIGGANLRNVWDIPTQAYKQAHFATFPTKLVTPCIKADTSQHGVCAECGAPWQRVVEVTGGLIGKGWTDHKDDLGSGSSQSYRADVDVGNGPYQRKHTGWQATCTCGTEAVIPATVLDPFAGSGTTGMVAVRLGRDAVLVEISAEYAQMAQRRIQDDGSLVVQVNLATG